MKQRLQKILSAHGVSSRRESENLITAGRVTVNGVPAVVGQSADPETDEMLVNGAPLRPGVHKIYIMLNKPKGYVTTLKDDRDAKTSRSSSGSAVNASGRSGGWTSIPRACC
jgi:23S rRNA pseudouridine2605 synthase